MKPKAKRPVSTADQEEDIEVKPSTELTPDEYERRNNENMLVHLFYSRYNGEANDFRVQLTEIGYTPTMHPLDSIQDRDTRMATLKQIRTQTSGKDGMILVFLKVFFNKDELAEIWSLFTSINCPALKNKPKIFIFQVQSKLARDTTRRYSVAYTTEYDTPSEADMMIFYEKLSPGDDSSFIPQLTDNIEFYAEREDITSLVTYCSDSDSDSDDEQLGSEEEQLQNLPESHLLISTMTRKFFFVPAKQRGHHHVITKIHQEIDETLNDIRQAVDDHRVTQEPKNGGKSLTKKLSSLKKSLSFRNKTPDVSPKAKKSKEKHYKVPEEETFTKEVEHNSTQTTTKENLNKKTELKDKAIKSEEVNRDAGSSKETSSLTPKLTRLGKKSTVSNQRRKGESANQIGTSQESIGSNKSPTTTTNKRPLWKY